MPDGLTLVEVHKEEDEEAGDGEGLAFDGEVAELFGEVGDVADEYLWFYLLAGEAGGEREQEGRVEVESELGGFLVDLFGDVAEHLAELFGFEAGEEVVWDGVVVLFRRCTYLSFEVFLFNIKPIDLQCLHIISLHQILNKILIIPDRGIGRQLHQLRPQYLMKATPEYLQNLISIHRTILNEINPEPKHFLLFGLFEHPMQLTKPTHNLLTKIHHTK
jgi:hypothetical protein